MHTACGGAWALGGGDRFGNQSPKCFYAYVNGDGSVKDPGQRLLDGSIDK